MKCLIIAIILFLINNQCIGRQRYNHDSTITSKNIISMEETQKLKDSRDKYEEINGLENLYEDKTHSDGLPYHIYIPEKLHKEKAYPLVIFLFGYSDLSIDKHKSIPKGLWSLPLIQTDNRHIVFIPRYRGFDDMCLQDSYRKIVIETINYVT